MQGLGSVGRWLRGCVPEQLRHLLPQGAADGRESSPLQAALAGGADGEEDDDDVFLDCDTCEATQVCMPADLGAALACHADVQNPVVCWPSTRSHL